MAEKRKNSLKSKTPTAVGYTIHDLFKGKHLEVVAAALLLSGKLKVDSVEFFRGSPAVNVTLVGQYVTNQEQNANALADFLEKNGDMTIDDVIKAFQKRINKRR